MRVLWFEVTVPGRYKNGGAPIGGWQDSLEEIVRTRKDIDLVIAFEGIPGMIPKMVDGVKYMPLVPIYFFLDKKLRNNYNRWNRANKIIPLALKAIDEIKPDIIQVFGSEWEFGQVAKYIKTPVVLHMQGCIAPYNNASFPPGYSISDQIIHAGLNFKRQCQIWLAHHFSETWEDMEQSNFKAVSNYMGRTEWDQQLVELFHPGAHYFHVEEALRPSFVEETEVWQPKEGKHKIRLITTGCSSFLKGMDTLLRTAHVMKKFGFDFEWIVAGKMGVQKEIERKEKIRFADNNVNILGFIGPDKLLKLLLSSDIYVHTAYVENSPNAICEAQFLGIPIISTDVGGIPSLVENDKDGVLVPANSCYIMAYEIMKLAKDKRRQQIYSVNNIKKARNRHSPQHILKELLECYNSILNV